MRYYIYISDSKLDMLYPQIPKGNRSKIAAGLKIDLKVVELSLSEKATQDTRYSKLKMVEEYINKNEKIGTIDAPAAYFQGTTQMSWGRYGIPGVQEIVYFGTKTEKTILGLAGSTQYIIGNPPQGTTTLTGQSIPFIMEVLERPEPSGLNSSTNVSGQAGEESLQSVVTGTDQISERPPQRLEFLAKRLIEGELRDKHVLLGSPIYVAIAD